MRTRKIISLIILLGLFLLPLMDMRNIHSVVADELEPPPETDNSRLNYDEAGEGSQSEIPPIEEEGPEIVDQTLGVDLQADPVPEVPQGTDVEEGGQGSPSTTNETGNTIESLNYNPVTGLNILDNFNRANGSLGSDWTVHDGAFSITGEMAVGSGNGRATYDGYKGDGDTAEMDVEAVGTAMQYAGLLLNYGAGANNLWLKVQQQGGSGQFEDAACYKGSGVGFGRGYFELDSPFTTAHMKATRVGETVTIVFSNIDGGTQPSQTYICDGAPPPEGNGVGIAGYSGVSKMDNFSVRGGCEKEMHDNGPLVTHEGAGFGGADASATQVNALGMVTIGWGSQYQYGNRLADEFEVTDPGGWQVNAITIPAFQDGSTTTPTINGLYYQIWDGPPDNPSSKVVFGNLTTNRLISTVWTGIYRTLDNNLTDTSMPIMANNASAGVFLPQGTYWLDWMIDGSLASGPWVPPITVLGQTTTGNAMQYVATWGPVLDGGTNTPQGMPFLIHGCRDNVLWNQPLSTSNPKDFYANQIFPDPGWESYTCIIADDFFVDQLWSVESLYFPGGWHSQNSITNATEILFEIYEDWGGTPSPPILAYTFPINSPYITLYLNDYGTPGDVMVTLPNPIVLPPGHYWLGMSPELNFGLYGQWGRPQSDTINGNMAQWINPGGSWGYGTNWQVWTILNATKQDAAFRISGAFKNYLPLIMK